MHGLHSVWNPAVCFLKNNILTPVSVQKGFRTSLSRQGSWLNFMKRGFAILNIYFEVFRKYHFLLQDLVARDFKLKYRRSILGFLWSILNPLLMMLVITAVFSNMFKSDIQYFPVYYLCGYLIFNFVVEATNGALTSIVQSGYLIKKVYIPKYIFPLEKTTFALVNVVFSFAAVLLVILITKMPIQPTILLIPIPVFYAFVFSTGLGLILASCNTFFRDTGHLYSVWTTAWMYLTPLFYPLESIPESIQKFIFYNPLYYFVTLLRELVIEGRMPDPAMHLTCICFSLLFLLVGLFIFKRSQDRFILYI